MKSHYHGSKFYRQRRPFALPNDGRKVWAPVLFLNAVMYRKVIHVNFFFCHISNTTVCWHPEILLPWQRGNDVFCLFYSSFWLLSRTQISHCLVNWSSRFQTKNVREIWLRYCLWGKFSEETIKKNYSFYTQRNKSFLI